MNSIAWTERFVGIPYSEMRCDELVRAVYKNQLEISLPDDPHQWRKFFKIAAPLHIEPLDILVIAFKEVNDTLHLAVAVDGSNVLHSYEQAGGVVLDRIERVRPLIASVMRLKHDS